MKIHIAIKGFNLFDDLVKKINQCTGSRHHALQ